MVFVVVVCLLISLFVLTNCGKYFQSVVNEWHINTGIRNRLRVYDGVLGCCLCLCLCELLSL